MIARSFKSVLWVATVGGAALGCYMVSLKVATERADLTKVERQIVTTQRDIRSLQTELGTRGRLAQLEDWNANVLALSAPAANQFIPDHVSLARLETRDASVEQRSAEVRLASLDTGADQPAASASKPSPAAAKAETVAKPARTRIAKAPAEAPAQPKLIRAVQTASAAPSQPSLIHNASFTTAPAPRPAKPSLIHNASFTTSSAQPPRTAKPSRIESIASELGMATRPSRVEKTGRERSAGTR
ncbi:MAG: hypothetical protein JWP15_2927 [Alphaproteobacteria bacterium]|nr:hypothetical protein [Alphaproteobacteria bacterium]